jgi:predicted AlkP superfamily pyrophosphatase or phosphodiesterase
MTKRLLVIDVVGLTPKLLAHMPRVASVAKEGFSAELGTVLPAVTCSVQSTFLTGEPPSGHGVVGNGWYFRELGEVLLWRQHNKLVDAEKVWEVARREDPGFTVANVCWWYAMGATTDWTVTPRPIYYADGKKAPDCYTRPAGLHDELTDALGTFPLFQYWGPTASIVSSAWIADATRLIMERKDPTLTLCYLPHLDYDLQRFGPDSKEAVEAAIEIDAVAGDLIDFARSRGTDVIVLSEYGITQASRPVDVNRELRRYGYLQVYVQDGMEYLDPWVSRAFAVADHQVAHVYVASPEDVGPVRKLLASLDGVDVVLDEDGKRDAHLDHERAGELVAVAEPDAWFTYYYWLDDSRAPDFARNVEIHRKPGYDPAELFMDPDDPLVKAKAGMALARKKLGFRYSMQVVPLDPSPVRGSHGRLPASADDGPVLLCSDASVMKERYEATEVRDLMLTLLRG